MAKHFGKHDHNYSHCLQIRLGCGRFSIPHLMMRYDEAALAQKRDAAPLRLISWLTFGLPMWLQDIMEALMIHYGNVLGPRAILMHSCRNTFPIAQHWSLRTLSGITLWRESVSGTRSGSRKVSLTCSKVSLNGCLCTDLHTFLT